MSVGGARKLSKRRFDNIGLNDLILLPEGLNDATLSHLRRYACDMFKVMTEIRRILKPMGRVVLAIGSSNIRGRAIDSPGLIRSIGQFLGLRQVKCIERELPNNRRYLPPPTLEVHQALQKRMRSETVLTLEK